MKPVEIFETDVEVDGVPSTHCVQIESTEPRLVQGLKVEVGYNVKREWLRHEHGPLGPHEHTLYAGHRLGPARKLKEGQRIS